MRPGESWNFILTFSRTGKTWNKTVGPGKSWKSAELKQLSFQNLREKKFIQGVKKTGFEILGMKGFKLKFGVLEKSI